MPRHGNITLIAYEECRARKVRISFRIISIVREVLTDASAIARY